MTAPAIDTTEIYTENYYSGADSFFYKLTGGYKDYRSYFDRLARWFSPHVEGPAILDVGCAFGRISQFMQENGYDVTGVDYSQRMVDLAKGKFKCIKADARALPFIENEFDLVLTDGLLEHFEKPDVEKMIKEEHRVCKKDGLVLNLVPSDFLINHFLEWLQRTPRVYWRKSGDWQNIHKQFNFRSIEFRKLKRLDAFICKK